jgi:hypothetical protein
MTHELFDTRAIVVTIMFLATILRYELFMECMTVERIWILATFRRRLHLCFTTLLTRIDAGAVRRHEECLWTRLPYHAGNVTGF